MFKNINSLISLQLGQLSLTLHLEMDNCWREYKNKFILTFLALLDEIGIFKEVTFILNTRLAI